VTRGFGDKNLKRWISSRPDVTKLKLMPECEFLILASDGLWDKVIK
jgi:serine/threonine protein phosphatase PrpC